MEYQEQSVYDPSAPRLVPRSDIPISSAPADVDLEVRPFLAHGALSSIIPPSAVTLAWTHARPGMDVGLRSHPTPGLLIVLQGKAELLGRTPRPVQQGDVITLPSHHEYGFTDVGPDGLDALLVEFREQGEMTPEQALTLEQLLNRNEEHARAALESPFFLLLRDGALSTDRERSMLYEALRVFSDAFQMIMFTRQATCRDEQYRAIFDAHLLEELGHNKLLTVTGHPRAVHDPILQATSSWFCHQMLVLDNIGKAVVHVVLETAGHHFHNLAKSVFGNGECAEYFHTHAAGDEGHVELGLRLLEGQHPDTYHRLTQILDDSWRMFDTMGTRIAYLVELEREREFAA
jgi:hypothetical protein